MPNRIKTVCLILGLFVAAASTANAQYRAPFNFVPRVNRALGHWNGFGYHTCNPGPDSSYYNPWTAKNSYLISQSPQFLSRYGHELNPTPMDLLYSGQDAYGQSSFPSNHSVYNPPAALNADFVPNTRDDDEEEDSSFESDEDVDNEFMDDDLDDRFDEEADDLEKANDPFGDQADAFEDTGADSSDPGSLKENSEPKGSSTRGSATKEAASEQTTHLNTGGGIFLPASHRSFEW